MKNKFAIGINIFLCLMLSYINIASAASKKAPDVTVGIVKPVAIPAMTEIINGFKHELNKLYPGKINYIIDNAQGDMNIMHASFQSLKLKNVDLIVPIGTAAAQMADSINTQQPIVALAAEFGTKDRTKFKNKSITNILDEVDTNRQMRFIHTALPKLKNMTLLYSTEPQVASQVKLAKKSAKKYGINLQTIMLTSLSKMYAISRQINPKTQAIFILKDEPIVSGINTLIQEATRRHILLIASDDGSVQKGADFAVGVSEYLIGVGGAQLAGQVLQKTTRAARMKTVGTIPVKRMTHYHLYVSKHYRKRTDLNKNLRFNNVKKAAKVFGYPIETLAPLKG